MNYNAGEKNMLFTCGVRLVILAHTYLVSELKAEVLRVIAEIGAHLTQRQPEHANAARRGLRTLCRLLCAYHTHSLISCTAFLSVFQHEPRTRKKDGGMMHSLPTDSNTTCAHMKGAPRADKKSLETVPPFRGSRHGGREISMITRLPGLIRRGT